MELKTNITGTMPTSGRLAFSMVLAIFLGVLLGLGSVFPGHAEPQGAIAAHGQVLHDPVNPEFSYVNANAPKGGTLRLAITGSFQSKNPFSLTSSGPAGLRTHVFESLMTRAYDEPFSLYGLLAETIEVPEDRSWVSFRIRPTARFQDGSPVTAEDVVAAFNYLKNKGKANHRTFYKNVTDITVIDPLTVRMQFAESGDRELPMIMALMPVFKLVDGAFIGSGPYKTGTIDMGRSVSYRRDENYWGRSLSVNRGRHNFDRITYDYFRDATAAFEAFRVGDANFRLEGNARRWAQDYGFVEASDGAVSRAEVAHKLPSGMYGFAFNTRRPIFVDIRVRRALSLVFDAEWVNRTLYGNAYIPTHSFFDNSALATGKVADGHERSLLETLGVEDRILENDQRLPAGAGDGRNRANRRLALTLLKDAGFTFNAGNLVGPDGTRVSFEILTRSREEEKLALTLKDALKSLGIEVSVKQADTSQYQARLNGFDFDMILYRWALSLSPGNEQFHYWSSKAADRKGSRNYSGIRSAAIDRVIEAIAAAGSRSELEGAAQALDRLLLAGNYVIPLFHSNIDRIAWRGPLKGPETASFYGFRLDAWWSEPTR